MSEDKMQCGACDSENLFPPTICDTCMTCHETTVRDLKELKPYELAEIPEVRALIEAAWQVFHDYPESVQYNNATATVNLYKALKPFEPKEQYE